MAIVKCLNPQCDYFERTVPEGDCCPYCGEPLNTNPSINSPPLPEKYYSAPENEYNPPPSPVATPSNNPPLRTVVEPVNNSLQLVHQNTGQTFTIDRLSASSKVYLGRQDGYKSDRYMIDVSNIPFAERVSRLHAYITWDNHLNSFTIVDDNSTNGTILNGKSLIPQRSYPLQQGDRLELGREHKIMFTIEIA